LLSHESISISDLNSVIDVSNRSIRKNIRFLHNKKIIHIHVDLEDLRKKIVVFNKNNEVVVINKI
jgi:DeoR/GlpR family transcriptional regulator of sugar metabolism